MRFRTSLAIVVAAVLTLVAASAQTPKWVARYDGPLHLNDYANAIALDASGNAYVTGLASGSGTADDYCTIKYDTNGNQLWVARYDGPAHQSDSASAIAVDAGGNVYVTGWSTGPAINHTYYFDYCTVKYDTNGNQLWAQRYDGPGHGQDRATAIAVDANGNAYVTGYSTGSAGDDDYCTIKYDTNGNQAWVQRYDGPAHDDDLATAIAVDASGNVNVTGISPGFGTGHDYCTVKYDTNGNQLWVRRYDGPGHGQDGASAITLDVSGNAYVTGYSDGGASTADDYCTIKYDTSGNQLWVHRYDGAAHSYDYATALAADGSGNAFVSGYSYGSSATGYDYCTIKYDANGNQLWVKRYDGPGHGQDFVTAVSLDGSGNAYVTGYSTGSAGNYDYCTIEYDTNGNQVWVQRYDGTGHNDDVATAIAADRNGNAYVTGWSTNALGNTDYLTIMYRPSATVSGQVQLGSYLGGAGIVGTLEYRLPGITQPVYSSQIALDVNGNYQDTTSPLGAFDLACKFPNWLRVVLPGVTIGVSGATANFSLTNGDANGDNKVNLLDLIAVLSKFEVTGTPPLTGDVNWDGAVNLRDLSVVLANFGKLGEP